MKKLFAMILMLSILLAAAGCGKEEQRPTGTTAPGHTTETVAPTHASEATVPTQDTEATTPTQPSEETEPTEPDEPTEPTQEPELVTARLLEKITLDIYGREAYIVLTYTDHCRFQGLYADLGGEQSLQIEVLYNEDGAPSSIIQYGVGGEVISTVEYTAVVDGQWMEQVATENGVTTRSVMTRDDSGTPLVQHDYDESGTMIATAQYDYDDGLLTSVVEQSADGTVVNKKEYRYDDSGNLSRYRWTKDGETVVAFAYKWEDGKLAQRTCTVGDLFCYRFHYDAQGNMEQATMGLRSEDGIDTVGVFRFSYKPVQLTQEEADLMEQDLESLIEGIFYYA